MGGLRRPHTESAAEAMNGDAFAAGIRPDGLLVAVHAPGHGSQRHIRQGLAFRASEHHINIIALRHRLQHRQRGITLRNLVLTFGFHPVGRYRPELASRIELNPSSAAHFTRPTRGQDCELDRSGGYTLTRSQGRHGRADSLPR